MTNIFIIGGGASGMMAAVFAAAECKARGIDRVCITLFEKMEKCGRKLGLTGKGRCNLTNLCTTSEFMENVTHNKKFLYSAINSFPPTATMEFFEALGVPLKVERANRVFPVSDRAGDVVYNLKKEVERCGVHIVHSKVESVKIADGGFAITLSGRSTPLICDALIIASGGCSYPLTGSTGDGFSFADTLGVKTVAPTPSLVALECANCDSWVNSVMGLALKNVGICVWENDKKIYSDFGEMLFCHFGISGPIILSSSAHMRNFSSCKYKIEFDLKPALDEQTLDRRLQSDFTKHINKSLANALVDLLPSSLISPFIAKTGLNPDLKVNSLTREMRGEIVRVLKHFTLEIKSPRPIEEAIITSGGVETDALDPKTMMVKSIPGLFFSGEIIDCDAYTGGFNLQIAFSTGVCAGRGAIKYISER